MRLGHATIRYLGTMPRCQSVYSSSKAAKQQSSKAAATKFQPAQLGTANKSDMCEKNRKIEIYLFTPAGQL